MPPVLGPVSPSPMRLKSCAGASGSARVGIAVAHDEQRQLGPGEALLDHERAAGVAERLAREVGAHRVARVGERLGDDHALARGEAVGLHDVGRRELLEERRARRPRRRRRSCAWRAVGTPASASTSFIHAFEPSSRAPAAPGPNAGGRGPAPRRRRPRPAAPRDRRPRDRRRGRRRAARPRAGSAASIGKHERGSAIPGLPGAANTSGARRRALQRPHERVLAPAASRRRGRARQAARGSTTVWRAVGADADEADRHADDLLDEAQVVARLGGKSSTCAHVSMSHFQPGSVS